MLGQHLKTQTSHRDKRISRNTIILIQSFYKQLLNRNVHIYSKVL